MTLRWLLFARLTQLQVNVLMISPDVVVTANPYLYFNHPFINGYNLCTASAATTPGVDASMLYSQNLRPDGPSVWAALQVTPPLPSLNILC